MKYQELNLKKGIPTVKLENGIQVKKYISTPDKIDLIQIALQKSEEEGIYNEVKLECYFHLNIIYLYTDIEFSAEDREDEMELYDILDRNDIIDQVIAAIGEDEYIDLRDKLIRTQRDNMKYRNTAAAVLTRIVQDLPKNAAAAKEIVDSFDSSKYQEVVNFATAANGGRNINTQLDALSTAANQESSSVEPKPKKVVKIKQTTKKD